MVFYIIVEPFNSIAKHKTPDNIEKGQILINLKEQKINTICVLALGLLGDVLMRTPVINNLRKIYPTSKITVVCDPIGKELFEENRDIDEIIVINRCKKNIFSYIYNKIKVQAKITIKLFDLIIDLYGGNSSYNMTKISFAKYQIGFKSKKIWTNKSFLKNKEKLKLKNQHHITNEYFKILKYFDLKVDTLDTKPIFYINKEIRQDIKRYKKSLCINNYYLISLGSGGSEKIMDMDKTFGLIEHIYQKYNLIPAIVLNPGQEYLQKQLIEDFLIPNKINYLKLKRFSISELAALMEISNFIIVPDTGLYHIAVAKKVPLFTVFTYTNPKLVEPNNGVYKLVFEEDSSLKINKKLSLKLGTKKIELPKIIHEFDEFYSCLS